jgi:hypothetical protein
MVTIKEISRFVKGMTLLSDKSLSVVHISGVRGYDGASALFLGAAVTSSSLAAYYAFKYFRGGIVEANELLNCGACGLASNCVEQDSTLGSEQMFNTVPCELGLAVSNAGGPYSPVETPMVRFDMEPIDEKVHRRVRRPVSYSQRVIAEVKVRFETPTYTLANRKAVRAFAAEIMKKHGVRYTEARRLMPNIVAAVFIPDKWELKAARMLAHPGVGLMRSEHTLLRAAAGLAGF